MPKKKNSPTKLPRPSSLTSNTEGLTLLGGGSLPNVDRPSTSLLETFPNPAPGRDYEICFTSNEFTSLCPITAQPDFATYINISYIPKERCIESKALKLYFHSFRNQGIFAEGIVNLILDDLVLVLNPHSLNVIGEFAPRGGIGLRVEASYVEKGNKKQKNSTLKK